MAATISVRALDANHDPIWGNGQGNFLTDINAVAQLLQTTLLLFQGEWWTNTTEGLPLFQTIIGVPNNTPAISLAIQQQILSVPYVTGILNIQTVSTPNRVFRFSCTVITQFGNINLAYVPPLPNSSAVIPS